jgi:ribosomal protein L18E
MAYKRGFRNPFRIEYEEVNVGELARFGAGSTVNADALRAVRVVQSQRPLKILGAGDVSVALTVEADRFSKQAKAKIEAAGGTVRWINGEPEPKQPKVAAAPAKKAAAKKDASAEKAAAKAKASAKQEPAETAEEEANDGAGS